MGVLVISNKSPILTVKIWVIIDDALQLKLIHCSENNDASNTKWMKNCSLIPCDVILSGKLISIMKVLTKIQRQKTPYPLQDHLQGCLSASPSQANTHTIAIDCLCTICYPSSVGACGLFPFMPLADLIGLGALSDK